MTPPPTQSPHDTCLCREGEWDASYLIPAVCIHEKQNVSVWDIRVPVFWNGNLHPVHACPPPLFVFSAKCWINTTPVYYSVYSTLRKLLCTCAHTSRVACGGMCGGWVWGGGGWRKTCECKFEGHQSPVSRSYNFTLGLRKTCLFTFQTFILKLSTDLANCRGGRRRRCWKKDPFPRANKKCIYCDWMGHKVAQCTINTTLSRTLHKSSQLSLQRRPEPTILLPRHPW